MTVFFLHLYLLILFVTNNKHLFDRNNDIHEYNTRNNADLHLPTIHLSMGRVHTLLVLEYLTISPKLLKHWPRILINLKPH
jgi:hypothetical protein